MPSVTDQTGRTIDCLNPPRRIVSLVPSQTELLFDLGLDETVVGITRFCVHPQHWFRSKQRVGGTKQIKLDVIEALNPDLIIANKEENEKAQIEALAQKFPVWVSDIATLNDALNMIGELGNITNRSAEANELLQKLQTRFSELPNTRPAVKAAYLIWKDPYMVAGGDTFINDMLRQAGFENVFAHLSRYPSITMDGLKASGCAAVLLSSEPYPFGEKHIAEIKASLPGAQVVLVDGELFSWYGSRLLHSPAYFQSLVKQFNRQAL